MLLLLLFLIPESYLCTSIKVRSVIDEIVLFVLVDFIVVVVFIVAVVFIVVIVVIFYP